MKAILISIILTNIFACSSEKKPETASKKPISTTQAPTAQQAMPTEVAQVEADAIPSIELEGFNTAKPIKNLQESNGKVVFLNYWGSWCPPCRMEMPSIQALYDKYGDSVEFVLIAMERVPGGDQKYIEKENFTFPFYRALSPIPTEYKPQAFPTTIILDKHGKTVIKEAGAADWNSPVVHQLLDSLIQKPIS